MSGESMNLESDLSGLSVNSLTETEKEAYRNGTLGDSNGNGKRYTPKVSQKVCEDNGHPFSRSVKKHKTREEFECQGCGTRYTTIYDNRGMLRRLLDYLGDVVF